MKNSDMPAMPLSGDAYNDFAAYDGSDKTSYNPHCQGLTKREYFAGLALQGILANQTYDPPRRNKLSGMAEDAVKAAGALLKELEK